MSATLRFPQRKRLSAVDSAKLLRQALKARFPGTKFSVKLSRGTGYGNVYVRWTDGPSVRLVEQVTSPFSGEGFDGMTDCAYHIVTNIGNGQESGLGLILTTRDTSYSFAMRAAKQVATYFGLPMPVLTDKGSYWNVENDRIVPEFNEYWSTMIHRAMHDASRYAR